MGHTFLAFGNDFVVVVVVVETACFKLYSGVSGNQILYYLLRVFCSCLFSELICRVCILFCTWPLKSLIG